MGIVLQIATNVPVQLQKLGLITFGTTHNTLRSPLPDNACDDKMQGSSPEHADICSASHTKKLVSRLVSQGNKEMAAYSHA